MSMLEEWGLFTFIAKTSKKRVRQMLTKMSPLLANFSAKFGEKQLGAIVFRREYCGSKVFIWCQKIERTILATIWKSGQKSYPNSKDSRAGWKRK